MSVITDMSLKTALQKYFGFDSFKGTQEEVIKTLKVVLNINIFATIICPYQEIFKNIED